MALGSGEDVRAAIAQGPDLEARDFWSRTAYLVALFIGDLDKATLLRDAGADPNAHGRCGHSPLHYAIQGHCPDVLRWLLDRGADVDAPDRFGDTPLFDAVSADDLECVEILLRAGAKVEVAGRGGALRGACSAAVIRRLLEAGADPAGLSDEGKRVLLGLPGEPAKTPLETITREEFSRTFARRFGRQNAERMEVPFWTAMFRSGVGAYVGRQHIIGGHDRLDEPVWCAQRFGQTLTPLHNGRVVLIAGEHEDYYDPDFCIYNDVIVYDRREGAVAIYGYPDPVFPPTDFHTATLMGDGIYVIGSLGYTGKREYGRTPVFRFDAGSLRVERLEPTGEAPGWIYRHRAEAVHPREIRVWGGQIVRKNGDRESHDANPEAFVLNLQSLSWRRER